MPTNIYSFMLTKQWKSMSFCLPISCFLYYNILQLRAGSSSNAHKGEKVKDGGSEESRGK